MATSRAVTRASRSSANKGHTPVALANTRSRRVQINNVKHAPEPVTKKVHKPAAKKAQPPKKPVQVKPQPAPKPVYVAPKRVTTNKRRRDAMEESKHHKVETPVAKRRAHSSNVVARAIRHLVNRFMGGIYRVTGFTNVLISSVAAPFSRRR
ncbi:collagen alpha-1 chain B-like protein, putative [Babesia ovis]|uniref:Collagen alpha-1 chain B-like protein, putative n=1 Tax=Babesia ovis TaxID=5869 RepID=A0A9W5TF67_BABOV|nr:collagen alpha-1 chain B-like protein, putative [Babesia ovis]